MREPAHYLPLPSARHHRHRLTRADAVRAVALALADAERYRLLLMRATRNAKPQPATPTGA